MNYQNLQLIGIGLYSVGEAAHLIKVPSQTLYRWLNGYKVAGKKYKALWQPKLEHDGTAYLSFLDLIQAKLSAAFISYGMSPQKVRAAIKLAEDVLKTEHPFATGRFQTDGKTIMLEVLDEDEDARLIDLFKSHYLMTEVVRPSFQNMELEDDTISQWWPLGKKAGIVVDPRRQFGQPIDANSGVPTSILAAAVNAEHGEKAAALAFEVPLSAIRNALQFEKWLAEAKQAA